MRRGLIGLASFMAGAVVTSAAWTAVPSRPKLAAPEGDRGGVAPDPTEDLRRANANLTESLHACDRELAELRERSASGIEASAVTPAPVGERDSGRSGGRRRERGETSPEDWERMAQLGVVRVRLPCIRDTPWKPSERAVDRLGLAPQDVEALEQAYATSNKRVREQLAPLCAKALGMPDALEELGATACIDAIQNKAKQSDPKAAKDALSRAAEVQAGKRPTGGDAAPLEALANVLAAEAKAFERDLAESLGPEDARRIASDPALCSDRRTLRASDDVDDVRRPGR